MATRFYLPSSGTSALTPAISGSWGGISSSGLVIHPMSTTKAATPMVGITNDSTVQTSYVIFQYISANLGAQTISGNMSGTFMGNRTGGTNNSIWDVKARIFDASGTVVRGVLYNGDGLTTLPTSYIVSGSPSAREWGGGSELVPITSVTSQAGDVIVIELGIFYPDSGATYTTYTGDNGGTDLPFYGGTALGPNPWMEFSQNLTFGPPVILNANTLMMKGHGN